MAKSKSFACQFGFSLSADPARGRPLASWSLRTIQEAIYGKHSTNDVAISSSWSSGNQMAAANGPHVAIGCAHESFRKQKRPGKSLAV